MQITVPSHRIFHEEYALGFTHEDGWGYSFNSDKDGQILSIGPCAWASIHAAIDGFLDGTFTMSVQNYSRYYREPTVGICDCGAPITLYSEWSNSCDSEACHLEFNLSGQRLREGWRRNSSNWDEDMDDMEGYERGELAAEGADF